MIHKTDYSKITAPCWIEASPGYWISIETVDHQTNPEYAIACGPEIDVLGEELYDPELPKPAKRWSTWYRADRQVRWTTDVRETVTV